MSDNGKRHHCLRPLTGPLDHIPTELMASRAGGPTADAVSRALVGVVRKHTGRGPTKVRTDISSDLAIVTLEDSLTPAEQTLVSEGRRALVTQFRTALHDGMRAEAVEAVEEITGRQVTAYLTAQEYDRDLGVIAFHFTPAAHLAEGP